MNNTIERLKRLSIARPNDIRLYYQNDDGIRKLMKCIGRVPSKFDKHLLEFLKFTNGASILDYCFMGFKNNKLAYGIDEYALLFWQENNQFALKAIPFITTTSKEHFCYWIENDNDDVHTIVYISPAGKVHPIASCFMKFMETFVTDIEDTINDSSNKDLILYISKNQWPENIDHWMYNDPDLSNIILNKNF